MKFPPKRRVCGGGKVVRESWDGDWIVGPIGFTVEYPTGMNGNPIPLNVAISVISGVKIHPPKKPFRNLARTSSSDRPLISAFERMIERESVINLWCLGLTIELRE